MMHKMRWDDLQFVHEVATHGSLSAAARSLGVNHATVLRRITALEDRFEIRLFERPPGGCRLTPEGRELLSPLQMIGRTVDSPLDEVFCWPNCNVDGKCACWY